MKCYHFCDKNFYNSLLKDKLIHANNIINYTKNPFKIGEDYVKEFVFKNKKINNGNGMFFAWSNPNYKGEITYTDKSNFILLELDVPEEICIKTNYENWCSLGMDIFEANGDLELANKICKEEIGIKNGLEGSYDAIFYIDENSEIQILLPSINIEWVISASFVSKKFI